MSASAPNYSGDSCNVLELELRLCLWLGLWSRTRARVRVVFCQHRLMIGHGFVRGMTWGRLPFTKPTFLRSYLSLIMYKQDIHVHGGELSKNVISRGFWDERKIHEKPCNSGTPKNPLYMSYLEPCLQALAEQ